MNQYDKLINELSKDLPIDDSLLIAACIDHCINKADHVQFASEYGLKTCSLLIKLKEGLKN